MTSCKDLARVTMRVVGQWLRPRGELRLQLESEGVWRQNSSFQSVLVLSLGRGMDGRRPVTEGCPASLSVRS